jgi:hypothetical protein
MLNSSEKDYQKFAVHCLRVYVSENNLESENGVNNFFEQIIDTGVFKALADILLKTNDDTLIVSEFS